MRRAAGLDWATWGDLLRAIVELAVARLRLRTRNTRELLGRAEARNGPPQPSAPDRDPDALVDRVAFAIPRAGRRVPWRADCLVQALAAQHWLRRRGIATTLFVGVRKDQEDFAAHAWLMAGDRMVTGGQVAGYNPIYAQSTELNAGE